MARPANCILCGKPKGKNHKCLKHEILPTPKEIAEAEKEAERKAWIKKRQGDRKYWREVARELAEENRIRRNKWKEKKAAEIKERKEFREYNKQKAKATIERLEDSAYTWKNITGKKISVERKLSAANEFEKRRAIENKIATKDKKKEEKDEWQIIEKAILSGLIKFPPEMKHASMKELIEYVKKIIAAKAKTVEEEKSDNWQEWLKMFSKESITATPENDPLTDEEKEIDEWEN